MADLSTKYMGINLKNPIIVGASSLTADLKTIKKIEESNAGAIVIKSLFEEQIQLERYKFDEELNKNNERYAEMTTLNPPLEHAGPKEHLMWVKKTVESIDIPVIASLNAVNYETWIEYSIELEKTGVNGLELNFYSIPKSFNLTGKEIENQQLKILNDIKKKVTIPVSVKLSSSYSNMLNIIKKMDNIGVNGFVLFNRFFQPDIDVYKEKHIFPFNLSRENDYRMSLRFAGLLYNRISADICSSRGIFGGYDIIKLLLSGSTCVQIVSALYKKDIKYINEMRKDINSWMEEKNYKKIEEFRGKLSNDEVDDKYTYKRAQYVDLLMNPEKLDVKEPLV
ncbi:MAG: dihydroorotate dehydrogenase-like protein [Candidatus Mcinerneyibacterium aminivorans]|uniref:Dihydroorotate dehydrogenase-like protein n=1 Tax=Candidatus Mcinerneyibacterium aminivorans TaxID=2703815 RepID=A0A5D0MDR1_9BACT|nr:MAG: dihydroorotate dehydrogenase-like protein [Candidatus Mcinerneyibacterium aminivorans]